MPSCRPCADQEEEVALPGQPVRGGVDHEAPYGVDTPQEMKSAPWLEGTLFIDATPYLRALGMGPHESVPEYHANIYWSAILVPKAKMQ